MNSLTTHNRAFTVGITLVDLAMIPSLLRIFRKGVHDRRLYLSTAEGHGLK